MIDDLIPLERRSPGHVGEEGDLLSPGDPAWPDEGVRRVLVQALVVQRALCAPSGGFTLEQLGGFWTRAGVYYRCLSRVEGSSVIRLERRSALLRVMLGNIHITPQRVVRGAPLVLLNYHAETGQLGIVLSIDAIARVERARPIHQALRREDLAMNIDPLTSHSEDGSPADLDPRLKALCQQGAWDEAMGLIGEVHGPSVRGMLLGKLRDESEAHEVWLQWFDNVRKALGSFRWEARFSTWSYRIALNAFFAHKRKRSASPQMVAWEPGRHLPEQPSETVDALRNRNHEATYDWVKTTNINHFRDICQNHLSDAERKILMWRLHERRSWKAIAAELHGEDASAETLKKEVQRLHVRYHRLVKKLRKLALQQGLLSPG